MKNNIAGLSMNFSNMDFKNIDLIPFKSYVSLLEYDIVLIDLNNILSEYTLDKNYAGKQLLSENDSFRFRSDFKRIKNELQELLKLRKTVYVQLPIEPIFYLHTGKKEYKNRQTTTEVKSFNLLNLLPVEIETTSALGQKLQYSSDTVFKKLFEIKGMDYCYTSYFESVDSGTPLAYVANTKKLIAKSFAIEEGYLIIFPSAFDSYSYPTKQEYRKVINSFLHAIDDLEEELKSSLSDFTLPVWTNKYNILDEKSQKNKIKELESKIEQLQTNLEQTNTSLIEIQKYKLSLTSSGNELETIIQKILLELGFKSKPTEHNRADGIFTYGERNIVTEIKGVNGSSAEKHGAQLEKWVSEFIEKEETTPKGLLIVNGFRKKDIVDRTENVFPNQMVNYSVKREHCLITTTQLLGLFIEVKNNPLKKEKLIHELLNTIGVYEKFNDYQNYLKNR